MKAIVYTQYGTPDVFRWQEVPKPTPKDNQVLIKVHASSVNAAESHLMHGRPYLMRLAFGLFKPKNTILGSDVAGTVVAVGRDVTQFQVGDEVFGDIGDTGMGAFAEYACGSESALVHKPANATFEQAASMPIAALTALQGLRDQGQIQAGQKVLISGAAGGVGSFALQIAKSYGCEVTGVCRTDKVEMVRSMGADHVIDYKKEDFTQRGKQYDLILDAAAFHPFAECKRALTPQGTYVLAGGSMSLLFQLMLFSNFISEKGGKQFRTLVAKIKKSDLQILSQLLETKQITPMLDRSYPLDQVADALRYLESGNVKGKVVITVA